MEKLFKYSKVAAYVYIFIFVARLCITLAHFLGFRTSYNIFLNSLGEIVVLLWFVLIIKLSTKRSPLIVPSIIGIISQLLGIAQLANDHAPIFNIFSMSYAVLNITTYIWLSSYFEKKSKLQIMSICLAFAPILTSRFVNYFIDYPFRYVVIPYYVVIPLLYICFFIEFSKLNKN